MKTLYYNGNIITMTDRGHMRQAVLCQDGKILAVGSKDELMGEDVSLFDLNGKTMLPAFIDGHSHITTVANTKVIADLSNAVNIQEVQETLTAFKDSKGEMEEGEFIVGFGYDNNFFPGKKHPTKEDLDKVSTEHPVMIAHASGHMGVCNSKALEIIGITDSTPNPEGGLIGKDENGHVTGYLEETAFTSNASYVKQPDYRQMCRCMESAQQDYFKYGITTIQDGFTGYKEWGMLKQMSDDGVLTADVVCYVDINKAADILKNNPDYNKNYINNLKIGGYKLFLDGSPQGRTAWMTKLYENSGDYCGYPIYNDEQVLEYVKKAIEDKQQLLCHCNGDGAAQQFIDSYKKADLRLSVQDNYRPVMVHAQLTRKDQMPDIAKLGMIASFFVAHTWQWGDVHLENFGERGMNISAVKSAFDSGVVSTFHQDSPVLPPDMMHTVFCAVNRVTKNGVKLNPEESIDVYGALECITVNGAYQYGEEDRKGTIRPGKDASFVILSQNPLTAPKEKLSDIEVERTILRGKTVYVKD